MIRRCLKREYHPRLRTVLARLAEGEDWFQGPNPEGDLGPQTECAYAPPDQAAARAKPWPVWLLFSPK